MRPFFMKTNRIFTPIRKYSWLFILLVAFGGLWVPKLGLLMIPIMLSLAIMGFFRGKYWCGNFCPHGSLFDGILLPISRFKNIPASMKHTVMSVLGFSWFMYMLGSRLVKVMALMGTAPFLDKLGYIFVMNYFVVTIIGSILAVTINPRTWCAFCPMGTFEKIFYKIGKLVKVTKKTDLKVTIADPEVCRSCGKCSKVCPMQLAPYQEFSEKNQFDHESCIRCSTCVNNCPLGLLSLQTEDQAMQQIEKKQEIEQVA